MLQCCTLGARGFLARFPVKSLLWPAHKFVFLTRRPIPTWQEKNKPLVLRVAMLGGNLALNYSLTSHPGLNCTNTPGGLPATETGINCSSGFTFTHTAQISVVFSTQVLPHSNNCQVQYFIALPSLTCFLQVYLAQQWLSFSVIQGYQGKILS